MILSKRIFEHCSIMCKRIKILHLTRVPDTIYFLAWTETQKYQHGFISSCIVQFGKHLPCLQREILDGSPTEPLLSIEQVLVFWACTSLMCQYLFSGPASIFVTLTFSLVSHKSMRMYESIQRGTEMCLQPLISSHILVYSNLTQEEITASNYIVWLSCD